MAIGKGVAIHPTAFVAGAYLAGAGGSHEAGECTVGDGTRVWHHAQIRDGAVIGQDCVIGKGVYVDTGVRIGDRCKLQNGVNIYNGVILGDEVFVGPGVQFTNDKHPRAVGDWKITPTIVETGVSIGAGAVIVCGVTLGMGCRVGAGAVVTHDVAPNAVVVGNPAYQLDPDGRF